MDYRYCNDNEWSLLWKNVKVDCPSAPVCEPEDTYNSITHNIKKYSDITKDKVNHPAHYTSGKYEVIDIIKDKLTTEQFYGFLCGNVMKYITRWQNKNGLEDLKKAEWYLSYLIKEMENGEGIKE